MVILIIIIIRKWTPMKIEEEEEIEVASLVENKVTCPEIVQIKIKENLWDEEEVEVQMMEEEDLIENMKMMLTTYLIRNRWNVQIIEQQ